MLKTVPSTSCNVVKSWASNTILTSCSFELNFENRTCDAIALKFEEMYQHEVQMAIRVESDDSPPQKQGGADDDWFIVKIMCTLLPVVRGFHNPLLL
mmetsp:Transcript_19518/g.31995  ORF Transcript_19518/g.31995 Transcript_19518/m.31995 type:complete len:97 (-) Transcript_19518:37-327(-)